MIPIMSSLGPLETLSQAYEAYALTPTEHSPQQKAAIEAIDSTIDALNITSRAIASIEDYYAGDGIPDIYLDSHLNQTAELLKVGPLLLSYVLRTSWNAHLQDRTPLDSISLLVRQATQALSSAGWFLESALRVHVVEDDANAQAFRQDLASLHAALQPGTPAPLYVL
jgi:hypothetical protein